MGLGRCEHCRRFWRSQEAKDRAEAYHRIHAALSREVAIDAVPSKRERHTRASEQFRQQGAS